MIESMRRLGALLLLLVPLLTAAACDDAARRAEPRYTSPTSLATWATYHRTNDRSGHVARAPRGPLRHGWTRSLRGAVYGEPLVLGSTLVVATTENYVYGLDARTGVPRWRRHLGTPQPLSGLPCGNVDPLGVISTPAYSGRTGSVYVAAETRGGTHRLWALTPRTGAVRWHRGLDTQRDRNRLAEQQRSALSVVDDRVVTTFGGLAGDCDDYVGYATSVPANGRGATTSYAVPTAREGGMWSPAGGVQGTNGSLYVASGNGAELRGSWDRSDSVTELVPRTMRRLSVFAPSTWQDDNVRDLDLGSSSPAVVRPVDRMVIAGKRGVVYLLRPDLGGIGSEVASLSGCTAFGGAAVSGTTVLMPCKGETSIRALRVGASSLSWSWTRSGVYGSPVIAGTHVYAADEGSGDLVVLRLSDGAIVQRRHVGELAHFPSQVVSGDWVFVPTMHGVSAFRGR
jgi:outer membrane protein assembly factor BamB